MDWHKNHIKMWDIIYKEIDNNGVLFEPSRILSILKNRVLIRHFDGIKIRNDCFACEESERHAETEDCLCSYCPFDVHNTIDGECMDGLWGMVYSDYINYKENKLEKYKQILLENVAKIRDFPLINNSERNK